MKDENESDMQQQLKTHSKHMEQQIQNSWVCITIICGGGPETSQVVWTLSDFKLLPETLGTPYRMDNY